MIPKGGLEATAKFIEAKVYIKNRVEGTRYPTSDKMIPAYFFCLNAIIVIGRVTCVRKIILEIIFVVIFDIMENNIVKGGRGVEFI